MKALLLALAVISTATADHLVPTFLGSVDYVPYIIGGSSVSISSHPHQVSLQNSWGSHVCGGAIIGNTKVACAAHCTQGSVSGMRILAGSARRTGGGHTRQVSYVRNHPSFCTSCRGMPNDISVITVSQSFAFGSNVRAISLASSDFSGQTCVITGWGRTSASTYDLPVQLQGAYIKVISNSDCNRRMGNVISGGHICVYDSAARQGACNGDSGGPLVCGGQLAGVTSWGYACRVQYPSVYSRISYYSSWIRSQ